MENAMNYHIGQFDGPLDLLLSLISKNKIDIFDIPISLVCDQYLEYLERTELDEMELAGEFLPMACELMLIKSKMLLPRPEVDTEDPRAALTDALLRFQQAKAVAAKLSALYAVFGGRFVKETDEISIDKTFVLDQEPARLTDAIHKINVRAATDIRNHTEVFTPMIRKPVIPIDRKIRVIVKSLTKRKKSTIRDLLADVESVSDAVATFLGILELIKTKTLIIQEKDELGEYGIADTHGIDTILVYNPDAEIPVLGDSDPSDSISEGQLSIGDIRESDDDENI